MPHGNRKVILNGRTMFISLLLSWLVAISLALPIAPAQAKPPLQLAIKRQQFRQDYIKLEEFIDTLGITKGMTILDIGAGPGYASFLFAGKLHGSGEVFATDIRADFVDYIADEAKRKGLNNLFPALVKGEGFDDFYGTHRYDLVFLSNVYHCIDNRIEYFSKLRGLLKPNARLVLILYNQVPLFSGDDFSRLDDLVKSLSAMAEEDPFFKRLSISTRQLLKDGSKKEALKTALAEDFNRMLTDPQFYKTFYRDSYFQKDFFTAPEREFANWLLMTLKENGIAERPVNEIDARSMRSVIMLNRLFFIRRFGDYLTQGGMGAYLPAGDANRHTSKYVVFRELDAAGYKLDTEIALSPYYDAVIMTPKTP